MKVVILAGGYGTRISEESHLKPKPMIEIGEKPVLWHIMKIYSHYGFTDFIICLGYKGYFIKEYFAHYFLHESDVTFDFTKLASTAVATGHPASGVPSALYPCSFESSSSTKISSRPSPSMSARDGGVMT